MVRFKKKIVVFFITVAVGSSVLVFCSAQSATNGTASENLNLDAYYPITGAESKSGFLLTNDSDLSGRSSYNPSSGEFFFRAMFAVLFVVVLGVAAIYVSKKLLPKITNLPGKEIRVVETVHLGPRKAVHVLEIGSQRFLIGSTNENVTKLAEITRDLTDLSSKETDYN